MMVSDLRPIFRDEAATEKLTEWKQRRAPMGEETACETAPNVNSENDSTCAYDSPGSLQLLDPRSSSQRNYTQWYLHVSLARMEMCCCGRMLQLSAYSQRPSRGACRSGLRAGISSTEEPGILEDQVQPIANESLRNHLSACSVEISITINRRHSAANTPLHKKLASPRLYSFRAFITTLLVLVVHPMDTLETHKSLGLSP